MQIPAAVVTIGLLISILMLAVLVLILLLRLRGFDRDLAAKDALLREHVEYRAKAENLYHICQLQEQELDHLRALIHEHNIDC